MDEMVRLLVLLALGGAAFAVLGGVVAHFLDETRRITRTLALALGADPQPLLIARGRGCGIGFDLAGGRVAVAWDRGGWRLTYPLAELVGVELVVDRRVAARAFRGESRRPLDDLDEPGSLVRLRFVFDDPRHPEFILDLWTEDDSAGSAEAALEDANRWLARMDALLRRPAARAPAAAAPAVANRTLPPEPPPWEDDETFEDDEDDEDRGGAARSPGTLH